MNIEKIYTNNINNIYNKNIEFEEGNIIKGYIKSLKNNVYTIDLEDNISINVNKDKITGQVGDTIYFNAESKNTLKQITEDDNLKVSTLSNDYIYKDINPKNNINKSQKQYKLFLDKNTQPSVQENILYTSKIKNKLSHIANTTNEEDLKKFVNSGINPKNLDLFTFSDFLSISTGVDVEGKEKSEEKTLQELKEDKKKSMKMDLNMNGLDEEDLFSFEDILSKVGLPSTNKNITTLNNVKNKIDSIDSIDKNTALNIVKKGNNITVEDLYTAKHTSFSNKENVDINNIENLDEQIEDILKQNNIQVTEENINIAKDFIKNEIDISSQNIENYKKLQNIKDEINIDNILEKSAKNILKNENVLNVNIFNTKNIEKEYNNYKNILPNVLPEHIQSLIDNKIQVNLKNIVSNYENINIENINPTPEAISERLNLAKIQMKLTTQAMYDLYDKDINIDTRPLKEVINKLEYIEQENYKKSLEIVKAPVSKENINIVKNVFDTIQNIYPNVVYNTFKDIVDKKVDFSLTGINNSLKAKNIISDFETFKTMPNKSFGDSINKLTDDFKELLVKNGFEPNENNIKALKILSLNNMDFTEENILNVKLIDSKIEYVANKLHPLTVSKMLKESFNPMNKNINDIIEYIDNNSFGQTSREKIAEQILDIDKENKLSKEERDAIVSVYRMLNIVQKGDSVAIGNLLKTDKNITLSNLLQSSKIYEKNRKNMHFDKTVDQNTGESELTIPEANITKSINYGIEKANENYNRFILGQILNYANPDKINDFKDTNISIENLLSKLKEENKHTISKDTKQEMITSINNLENIDSDTINYLIKNNIPITLNNIQVMEGIIKENIKPSKNIDDFKKETEKRNISFGNDIIDTEDNKNLTKEEALNTIENLQQENEQVFDDIINLDDLDDIKYMILKNKKVSSSLNFLKDNNNIKNGLYTVPIKLSNGKITDLNMYILNDTALNDKNLNLYFNFENLDNNIIEAYVKVSNNGTLADISSKNNKNINQYEKDILNILEKFKIYPDNITYSTDNEKDLFKQDSIIDIQEKFKNMDSKFNQVI